MDNNELYLNYPDVVLPDPEVSVYLETAWDGGTVIKICGLNIKGFECYIEMCEMTLTADFDGATESGDFSAVPYGHLFFDGDDEEAAKEFGDDSYDFDDPELMELLGADLYNAIAEYALTVSAIDMYNRAIQKRGQAEK